MESRKIILSVALLFTFAMAYLTIDVAVSDGVTPLVVLSMIVIALFGFGIIGALRHPPEE